MIRIEDYPILQENITTLKETSKDNHDGEECFMTDSVISVIDFDAVKDEYVRPLGMHQVPKSNDALVIDASGKATFIEFKNGRMNDAKKYEVRKKILDSMLIFTDLIEKGITHTRTQLDYILVYNENANDIVDDSEPEVENQLSESRDEIAKKLMGLGKEKYVKFGLEMFERYCFQNVYTYTKEEFEENFVQKIAGN
ncbi:hypothetical protein LJC56_06005 [Christensenellaceae bacterium OttesenSCG-928-K19]|nr:hypothetical protein [Christensenellaceae bacterium OttesenSCG-928-K19]